ncbi:MAG: dihydropteroate synthase [Rickettsiales bacterium]
MKKFETKIVGALNLTPDSFSDGGRYNSHSQALAHISDMISNGVDVIDVGAESTRPDGVRITVEEEKKRLDGLIQMIYKIAKENNVKVSLDSHNIETLTHYQNYYDIINDVTGLSSDEIISLQKDTGKEAVFMRSLTVPVIKTKVIDPTLDPIIYIQDWLNKKIDFFTRKEIDLNKLIFDPGIGFGLGQKNDMLLIKKISDLNTQGLQLMVGHSRKSFLQVFGSSNPRERDPETHVLSSYLINLGVDYIRVHDVESTARVKALTKELYS